MAARLRASVLAVELTAGVRIVLDTPDAGVSWVTQRTDLWSTIAAIPSRAGNCVLALGQDWRPGREIPAMWTVRLPSAALTSLVRRWSRPSRCWQAARAGCCGGRPYWHDRPSVQNMPKTWRTTSASVRPQPAASHADSSSHSRQCSPAASEHPDRDLKAVATVATWTGLTSSKCPSGHHSSSLRTARVLRSWCSHRTAWALPVVAGLTRKAVASEHDRAVRRLVERPSGHLSGDITGSCGPERDVSRSPRQFAPTS